jgi:hypothetical protein
VLSTDNSSVRASFLTNWEKNIIMAVSESAGGKQKSQVDEFVEFFAGPGV